MPSNQEASCCENCGLWALLGITSCSAQYVLDYLAHGFPTQLYEPFTDSEGNLSSRPSIAMVSPCNAARRSNGATA